MRNIRIDPKDEALTFESASILAKEVARENQLQDPTIMAWHQTSDQPMPPYYDGADPDTWWAKYGSGNGGRLEVCVGDTYQFIMMDTRGFEKLGDMPLRNLTDDQGKEFLCHTSKPGKFAGKPTPESCIELDGWAADQY